MNAGVEIILERIKTHPEEFCSKGGGRLSNGKWSRVLDNYGGHLDEEDINAINDAIDKVNQDYFTEEVMTILVEGRDPASDEDATPPPPPPRQRIRLTSPDGLTTQTVMDKSPSFKGLISQGWIDPRRMITSGGGTVTLNSGAISGTWSTPTITIPPTNK